ncbi:MAG: tRNA pseudouridine(38-40) synthase TruA [Abditibacteriota bacterium]|nr:tRNA pseudouridine(38-40) synthase TruA [Abditibacteriota bacterium]
MNIKLVIEYDGTAYHGYQIQENAHTVQAELEKALRVLVKDDFVLYCAGRTDTGVHAMGQVCNFKSCDLRVEVENLRDALNSMLPEDISIKEVSKVEESFNSRYSAKKRVYRYVIFNGLTRNAIGSRYSWFVRDRLNLEAMKEASEYLVGHKDFKAFTDASYPDITERDVYYINIYREKDYINIEICANAFTRSMVRNIVGTLCEVGRGKREAQDMQSILNSRDRQKAGICAPSKGLFFVRTEY